MLAPVLDQAAAEQALGTTPQTLVVKFYTDWWPDCRRIQGSYAQFPAQFPTLAFAEVNSDANPELSRRFDIRGIPSFLDFRNGKLVDRLYSRGAQTVQQARDFAARQTRTTV